MEIYYQLLMLNRKKHMTYFFEPLCISAVVALVPFVKTAQAKIFAQISKTVMKIIITLQ